MLPPIEVRVDKLEEPGMQRNPEGLVGASVAASQEKARPSPAVR
jgi:hypothetical protein